MELMTDSVRFEETYSARTRAARVEGAYLSKSVRLVSLTEDLPSDVDVAIIGGGVTGARSSKREGLNRSGVGLKRWQLSDGF